jgi:hypothetical protein
MMLSPEQVAIAKDLHPDIRDAVIETWADVAKNNASRGARVAIIKRDTDDQPTPLLRELRRMSKQVAKLQAQADEMAGMSDEHKAYMAQMPEEKRGAFVSMSPSERDNHMANNPIKKFTGESLERFGKFALAMVDKQIDLQIQISKRAGDTDIQAYNRAITENPALYAAYEIAKRSAVPDSALCMWP